MRNQELNILTEQSISVEKLIWLSFVVFTQNLPKRLNKLERDLVSRSAMNEGLTSRVEIIRTLNDYF
jgi:hypothetical protein